MMAKYSKSRINSMNLSIGFLLGGAVFLFTAQFSRINIDVHHQGIMLSAAMRILSGEDLYVGKSFYYGPLVPILNAFGLVIFGKHLLVLQLMAAACYGGIAVLLWRIWARFLPVWLSAITVLLSFLLAPFLYWEFHPWSSIYALFFLLLSLYFAIIWVETKNYVFLCFSGIFSALVFWSRQTVGLPLSVVMAAAIFVLVAYLYKERNDRLRLAMVYFISFSIIIVIGVGLLFANDALHAWFESCFSSRLEWAISISGDDAGYLKVSWTIVRCLFDLFKPTIWMLLPVAMICTLALVIIKVMRRCVKDRNKLSTFALYISVCIVSWLQYYPVSDPRHHFWSALPMMAIPVIFLWKVYGLKINPLNGTLLSSHPKIIGVAISGLSGFVLVAFFTTYFVEIKQRLITGVQLDESLSLLPAWKRLQIYNTRFINPPILRGMLGSKSQVESLNRLHDSISSYKLEYPSAYLLSNSGWDFLANNYSDSHSGSHSKYLGSNITPPLILSDTPLTPSGYTLLTHEIIEPAFAYQLASPGNYYLFSAIKPGFPLK